MAYRRRLMKLIKLYLADQSRFRLGSGSLQDVDDIIHSDTLFNGWMHAYSLLYGTAATTDIISAFQQRLFICSSAFHFIDVYHKNVMLKTVLFFPKPILRRVISTNSDDSEPSTIKKAIKKLRFISYNKLIHILNSITMDDSGELRFTEDMLTGMVLGNEYALAQEELPSELLILLKEVKIREFTDAPKVVLSRQSPQSDDVYYQTDCIFHQRKIGDYELRPGFYFLFQQQNENSQAKQLNAALNLLADEGIGGERSSGAGRVERIEQASFDWIGSGERAMLMSLTLPSETDSYNNIKSWQPINRGGYIGNSGIRKKRFRLMREGSIVSLPFAGDIIKNSPDKKRPTFQYGMAFCLAFGEMKT